jgi:UDP-glucose 4-epimerase
MILNIVTGCCGFVGFHFTSYLLKKKYKVLGIDNFQFKTQERLNFLKKNKNFIFSRIDLSNNTNLKKFSKYKRYSEIYIWHLAANSDIKKGGLDSSIDFKNTFLTTFNILRIAEYLNVIFLFFSSSSAIYGKNKNILKEDDCYNNFPISNYGKMKLASEELIKSFTSIKKRIIYRFPNIIGSYLTHGVFYDFDRKIKKNYSLRVLGDGSQSKPYLHIKNLVKCIYLLKRKTKKTGYAVYNIGPNNEGTKVRFIARLFQKFSGKKFRITYQKKKIGWKGDVNRVRLSTLKFKKNLFKVNFSSNDEVLKFFKDDYNKNTL